MIIIPKVSPMVWHLVPQGCTMPRDAKMPQALGSWLSSWQFPRFMKTILAEKVYKKIGVFFLTQVHHWLLLCSGLDVQTASTATKN